MRAKTPKNSLKKELVVSGEAQDERQNDSVFDFLYQDVRRIGSFLAQFDDSGHLQQVREGDTAKRGLHRGFKLSAGGGVPLLASGTLGFEKSPSDEGTMTSERLYDPLWTNARTLLDYLEAGGLINRDITSARIGQFVIASGDLSVLNAAGMAKTWATTSLRDALLKT